MQEIRVITQVYGVCWRVQRRVTCVLVKHNQMVISECAMRVTLMNRDTPGVMLQPAGTVL